MKLFKILVIITTLAIIVFSCSNTKKNNPTSNEQQPPAKVTVDPITVPQNLQTSSDAHAQQVVMYVQSVNFFQTFTQNLIPHNNVGKSLSSQDALGGPPWVYNWTNGTMSFTLTITIEKNQYHWKLVLNGTNAETGQKFKDFVFIEAWQALDGNSGNLVINEYGEQSDQLKWIWKTDKNGTETVTYIDTNSNEKIEVVQKSDLSGTIQVWNNEILQFKAAWSANGSGTWWAYDEQGNQSATGTWG